MSANEKTEGMQLNYMEILIILHWLEKSQGKLKKTVLRNIL